MARDLCSHCIVINDDENLNYQDANNFCSGVPDQSPTYGFPIITNREERFRFVSNCWYQILE